MSTSKPPIRPFSRFSLAAVTAITMGVATFSQGAFGVLASDLIEEFHLERWQIGILLTANGFTGALLSPSFGRLTDRMGSVRSVVCVLLLAMATMTVVAVAPTYSVLFIGAVLYGLPNGWANPATNALIVDNVVAGTRGVITGIKQSGVQMGSFLGGLLLPGIAAATSWRVAFASFLIFPAAGLAGMVRRRGVLRPHLNRAHPDSSVPTAVRWIAVYGGLAGLGVSATTTFLPLFAEESEGWTHAQAGLLIAGVGLVGVIARITWGSASERWLGHGRTLVLLALQSAVAVGLLALASSDLAPSWVLIGAALLIGSGAVAWNAVGMLAVMDYSAPELVGRGTGLAMLGFLTGIGLGPPLMGLSVDRLGTYTPGWIVIGLLFIAGAVVAGRVHRTGTLAHV
ncbi:MAG TPA: MFS transporter [Acidimicrobiia bacterium]|nr:MFS transporter [Acidimicrobiia bacterium]